jgi:hypothetical protein
MEFSGTFDGWNNGNVNCGNNVGNHTDNSGSGCSRQSRNAGNESHRRTVHGRFALCERIRPRYEYSDTAGLLGCDCPGRVQLGPQPESIGLHGYVTKVLGKIPTPNNFDVGDGLNTAGFRWVRPEKNGTENIFGFNGNLARKQINAKIDHTVNPKNKLGVSYTYENSSATRTIPHCPMDSREASSDILKRVGPVSLRRCRRR